MTNKDLIELYLKTDIDDFELSIGRILAASKDDTYRASTDDIDKIKKQIELYFKKNEEKFKEILCDKWNLPKKIQSDKFDVNYEGVILIAEALEQGGFIPIPLTYPLIAVWLLRKKLHNLCD